MNLIWLLRLNPSVFLPEFCNSPEWRAISPAGKVPYMTGGDITMFESCAMGDYILESLTIRDGFKRAMSAGGRHRWPLTNQPV